jgi:predicted cobalt transporter CbtA
MIVVSFLVMIVHAEVHEVAEHHRSEGYRQHPAASQAEGREQKDQHQGKAAADYHH